MHLRICDICLVPKLNGVSLADLNGVSLAGR